ncbi:MAG TPA: histidine kinase [Nocardioides sp.]|nr:histidine kinase [Nocardioides sp.]
MTTATLPSGRAALRWPGAAALARALWLPVGLAVIAVVETATVSDEDVVLRTALAGATAFGVVLRRQQPGLTAAWVATGMAVESAATESPDQIGVLLAFIVAAFHAGAARDRREAVLGLVMLGLAVTVSIALDPSDSVSNVPPTLLLFVVVPAALGLGFARRERALDRLGATNARLRTEAAAALEAERQRLSHELHDVVSHAVTLIAVTAEAGGTLVRTDPGAAEQSFAAIAETSRDALSELQALLSLLTPDADPGAGRGLASLDALVEGVRAAGAAVEVVRRGDEPALAPEADLAAYRTVQEAMTNALRNSRSPRLHVEVEGVAGVVRLTVTSRGEPHRSTYGGTGRGLAGLRDRLESLGGRLDAGPGTDDSFVVVAEIPAGAS